MSQEVRAYLDEDLYDEVCEEANRTGESKSKIINDSVRDALTDRENWFMRSFAQSLFVVGFVLAFYTTMPVGIGTSTIGLGLMFWFQMQDHTGPETTAWEAFKRTLGVH
jgi:hypothetical protein